MKILALRGANLASLADPFEVDFRTAPLAQAGLFAISGPTGSGKSTLLDALCLALYGDTPRLTRAGKAQAPDVEKDTITFDDPRGILRRGAGSGFAEVEFVGADGVEYRARWTARRARSRSGGKLQPVEMSLVRLADGQDIGGSKLTEVKRACEEKVGLRFEQFTRAVLLAQNQFAAFLQADDNDRAELLEMLTGTDRFSELSRRAFQRAKAENDTLQTLRLRLAEEPLLSAEARLELAAELEQAAARIAEIELQRKQVEGWLLWHEQLAKAQQAEQTALDEVDRVRALHDGAAERRVKLHRVESVQGAREAYDTYHRLAADAHTLSATLVTAQNDVQQKRIAVHRALRAARFALDEMAAEECDLKAWLAEHTDSEKLARDWPRWDELLRQAQGFAKSIAEQAARLPGLLATEKAAIAACEAAAQLRAQSQSESEKAARDLADAAAALTQFDEAGLVQRRSALDTQRRRLDEASVLWRRVGDLRQRRAEITHRGQRAEAAIEEAEGQRLRVTEALRVAEATLQQAERALRLAETAAAANVESLRAGLEAETPCPVCGSTQHPYAESDPGLGAALAALREDAGARRADVDGLRQQGAALTATLAHNRAALAEAAAAQAEVEPLLEQAQAQWRELALAQEAPQDAAACAPWLVTLAADVDAQLEALAQREAQLRTYRAQNDAAQQKVTASQEALRTAEAGVGKAQQEQVQVSQRRESEEANLLRLETQLAGHLEALDVAFPASAWRQQWADDPEAFYARVADEAASWLSCSMRVDKLAEERQQARIVADNLGAVIEYDHAIADMPDADGASTPAASDVGVAYVRAAEGARGLAERLQQVERQQQQAESNLDTWLAAARARGETFDRIELAALLAFDATWLARERDALQGLDLALGQAKAVAGDRKLQRDALLDARPCDEEAEVLRQRMQDAQVGLDTAKQQHLRLALQSEQDGDRRLRYAVIAASIVEQEGVTRTWAQLSDVIGSADGRKFRNLAQQMTLDVLLAYANRHLASLARRYRLERIADGLGLMVVDQDMADEVRSVHSLSGGESFLVSLALALGLASLSSHRVRVESLFVDEGFGSLDADSLRIAMEALDGLQAQGRKVGVISHVQEMTERIGTQIRIEPQRGGRSRVEIA